MALRPHEVQRFWAKVVVDCASDCWVWIASRHPRGYGQFGLRGNGGGFAHRVAYETWRGPIPKDRELDHLCRVKACVNPWHLEPVPHRINVLRGSSPPAVNVLKTHCKHGHEFTPENTQTFTGRGRVERLCRQCNRRHCQARQRQDVLERMYGDTVPFRGQCHG